MTWTAPEIERDEPPYVAAERAALEGWLDFHRETLLKKCAGLTGEQLAERSVPPSTLSLLGLVRHMTHVERTWYRIRFAGEPIEAIYSTAESPDADLDDTDATLAEQDYAAFVEEIELARSVAAGRLLDETFVHPGMKVTMDLRWVYIHMIEEYARHNGHADLLRERVDGATGE